MYYFIYSSHIAGLCYDTSKYPNRGFIFQGVILGDSAGGNLALTLTNYIIDEKMRKREAICVISPPTDFSGNMASRFKYVYDLI